MSDSISELNEAIARLLKHEKVDKADNDIKLLKKGIRALQSKCDKLESLNMDWSNHNICTCWSLPSGKSECFKCKNLKKLNKIMVSK